MTYTPGGTALVIGATSRVGRLVVDALRDASVPVRALTRRPDLARLPDGVDVVRGDLTAPDSLGPALDGAESVFLIWTAAPEKLQDAVARLEARPSNRRRRVVLVTSPHRTPHLFFQQPNPLRRLHEEVERVLAAADLELVTLRPGMFCSNALHWWAPQIRAGDVVRWPYGEAETAPIDERDLAAVAARALLDDRHVGADYVLTGPKSLSQTAQVRVIGDAIGRSLRFEEVTPDAFRSETAGTWPPAVVEMLLGAWQAALGQPAFVTDAVETIVGTPARSFVRWAADNAAKFAGPSPATDVREG